MKTNFIILLVLVGMSLCTGPQECAAKLRKIAPILKNLIQINGAKNEAAFLSTLRTEGSELNRAVVLCENMTESGEFISFLQSSSDRISPKCYSSLHDSAFLGAIIRNQSINKEWDTYFEGLADFESKTKDTISNACNF